MMSILFVVIIFLLYIFVLYIVSDKGKKGDEPKWWEGCSQSRHLISRNHEIKDLADQFDSIEDFTESLKQLMGEDKYLIWVLSGGKIKIFEGLLKMKELMD